MIRAETAAIRLCPIVVGAIATAAATILATGVAISLSVAAGAEAAPPPHATDYLPSISDLMIATIQPRHERLWQAEQHGNWDFAAYELGNLRGAFNRLNAAGAALAARALGVDDETVKRGIESVGGVPGRFESIEEGQPFSVIVDYAHTPDSLANVLRAAGEMAKGDVIAVFGAGGDRDRGKRPLMGAAAAEGARFAILTSDNPRSEDPEAIMREVEGERKNEFYVEVDRRTAIERALAMARPGDVVVLAGRGAEPEQELATGKIPFDDRQVARDILRHL